MRQFYQLDNSAENDDARGMGYPGGKNGAGVYQRIINTMPPHEVYAEPFLGGGAVMRLKRPARLNIGLDLSASAVENFKAARLSGITEAAASSLLPGSADLAADGDGIPSLDLTILPETSSSITVSDRLSPTPATADLSSPAWMVQPGCGLAFLESSPLMASGSTLVYCDPPYLRSTRSGGRLYEFEMSDVDHRRLLRWAIAAGCRVMISGYWSAMYSRALKAWRCVKFNAMTRGGIAEECLWCNFEETAELHDYRYLGENFRERERIKRKTNRWTAKLARMPLLERRALLLAIANTDKSSDGGLYR